MDSALTAFMITRVSDLCDEGMHAQRTNTRVGYRLATDKYKEAASVSDVLGGADGAGLKSHAEQLRSGCLVCLEEMADAAQSACASLRAARASECRTILVKALTGGDQSMTLLLHVNTHPFVTQTPPPTLSCQLTCGAVARDAPTEMLKAEIESRKQKSAPSYHGGLDLSHERWISLPASSAPARLDFAYYATAIAICDSARAAGGGRGTTADDVSTIPSLGMEAAARCGLGVCLHELGEQGPRCLELMRQAVALGRQEVRDVREAAQHPGEQQHALAGTMSNLGGMLYYHGHDGRLEAEAILREALHLSEQTEDNSLKQNVLKDLANLASHPDNKSVDLAEAASLRSRMNQLQVQAGREPDTTCSIWYALPPACSVRSVHACIHSPRCTRVLPACPSLELLEQPAGGAEWGDVGCTRGDAGSSVRVLVLGCGHQFHSGCIATWWETESHQTLACPLCKKRK